MIKTRLEDIRNWKLKEVIENVKIIADFSQDFLFEKMKELNIPRAPNELSYYSKWKTGIYWQEMPVHYYFFYDNISEEDKIRNALAQSDLKKYANVIIVYGYNEPVIQVPLNIFLDDWEGFIRSTKFDAVIFSDDYSLVMESSRYYYLHSNFKIM